MQCSANTKRVICSAIRYLYQHKPGAMLESLTLAAPYHIEYSPPLSSRCRPCHALLVASWDLNVCFHFASALVQSIHRCRGFSRASTELVVASFPFGWP
eukprot:6059983-Amphidinium_carterae.1